MEIQNPFTPAFGGMPRVFFGRTQELAFAKKALTEDNSPHKAFFITGNRGSGKTTLLERISQYAAKQKWLTVDVHSSHAVQAIAESLAGGTQKTTEKELRPSAFGISGGGLNTSTTTIYSGVNLANLLLEKCRSLTLNNGILITIDEIQKVPESDAEDICAAVQLALRKGLPVMLVLAGLPGAKELVAGYPGCTFMQRTFEMQIGSLNVDETIEAFHSAFALVPSVHLSDEAIWRMGQFSQGYPYLMQLVGYYLVERMAERAVTGVLEVGTDDVATVEPVALEDYRANVLQPILAPLPPSLSAYLKAMCDAQQQDGSIGTGDVARLLDKQPQQVSSYRQRLIDKRIIEADGMGCARFTLPHVCDFYNGESYNGTPDSAKQWNRQ